MRRPALALALAMLLPVAGQAATGLTLVQTVDDGVGGVDDLHGVAGVAVSPDGRHVYAAARYDDAVSVFARDGLDGTLTFVEVQRDGVGGVDGLDGAQQVIVSPDGAHVYVVGNDAVAVFARDATAGTLSFLQVLHHVPGPPDGLGGPLAAALSPDGRHLYTASQTTVGTFARDVGSGLLTPLGVPQELVTLDVALAWVVTVSPDGANVYVSALGTRSSRTGVLVFARDGSSGALTLVEYDTSTALHAPAGALVAPGGGFVYVAGRSLAAAARDPATGAIAPFWVDGSGEIVAMLAATPDGSLLWAATGPGNGAAIFRVNPSGTVALVETRPGIGGSGNAIAPSPDGVYAYLATSYQEFGSRLAVLRQRTIECTPSAILSCRPAAPHRSTLGLKRRTPAEYALSWQWRDAGGTVPGDLATAAAGDLLVCAYDGSGARLASVYIPPLWRALSNGRQSYAHPSRAPDGIKVARMTPSTDGVTTLQVKGSGENLPLPALPLTLPVTVQLQSQGAGCWEAVYGAASTNRSDAFRAKSD